jgi:hypothetical protein
LGKANFTTLNSPGTTQSVMKSACDVEYDGVNARLYVADTDNNRVLKYTPVP